MRSSRGSMVGAAAHRGTSSTLAVPGGRTRFGEERRWQKSRCSIVELIGHTETATGLRVKAGLDKRRYQTGVVVTKAEMRALALDRHSFHGDWNYTLRPRAT